MNYTLIKLLFVRNKGKLRNKGKGLQDCEAACENLTYADNIL